MPSYQAILTEELLKAYANAKAAKKTPHPKTSDSKTTPATEDVSSARSETDGTQTNSKPTEEEYANLLETNPAEDEIKFDQFIIDFAAKLAEGKENLTQENAQKDSVEILKVLSSGNCGSIKEPSTATQLQNSLEKNQTQEGGHQKLGKWTAMIITEEEAGRTSESQPTR